jgi:two-component system phosphate regulon sensor histidine kinase PhoR
MSHAGAQVRELIKQNDELENYFRNTIIPQLFVDADLVLRKFTPPAMKQFSLKNDDIGRHIDEVKDNFRFPTITENIQQVIDSNEILEKEIQTTDLRWYQMNILPYVTYKDNKTDGVIITFIEITARIKDLKEQEALIADHETLLDTISHDFKTPLTSVVLAIELYKRKYLKEIDPALPLINTVEKGVLRMQALIKELIDTRKQQFNHKSDEELLSFENIIEDVRLTLSDLIQTSRAIIETKIEVSEILFSRRKLRSILYNLVNNAVKFRSEERPKIFISTYTENDFTVISVHDNGIGIAPQNQGPIFTKYFRIDEKKVEGTGIGLFLVREIVRNAGGRLVLESEIGKGSTFKIYLKSNHVAVNGSESQ